MTSTRKIVTTTCDAASNLVKASPKRNQGVTPNSTKQKVALVEGGDILFSSCFNRPKERNDLIDLDTHRYFRVHGYQEDNLIEESHVTNNVLPIKISNESYGNNEVSNGGQIRISNRYKNSNNSNQPPTPSMPHPLDCYSFQKENIDSYPSSKFSNDKKSLNFSFCHAANDKK